MQSEAMMAAAYSSSSEARAVRDIFFQEAGFVIKSIFSADERTQAYKLRHRIYCDELGWVPRSDSLIEIDQYDSHTAFIGVFDQADSLVGFMRMALPGAPFMIEKEFSCLIGPWHKIRKELDTSEATRACVAQRARGVSVRGNFGVHRLFMLVCKGIYHWCCLNNVRYVYMVVEDIMYRMLRAKGFYGHLVGEPVKMPDGCLAMAAVIDWKEYISTNSLKRPEFTKWFSQYRSDHYEEPLPRPEFYSPPRVFP
jgi:acyl homoserine lactone synthase